MPLSVSRPYPPSHAPGAAVPVATRAEFEARRIVLTTFGWFGDLYPYLALGLGLRQRGHRVVLATNPCHRSLIESHGLGFHPVRPDLPPPDLAPEAIRRAVDVRTGNRFLMQEMLMPSLRQQFDDLSAAVRGADLLVTHMGTYAAPLVAATQRVPFVTAVLQPALLASAYDPPVPASFPRLTALARLGPGINRWVIERVKQRYRRLGEPIERLRADLGLPPGPNPLFEGQLSPLLNLALFSPLLGGSQPDWPLHTRITGFPFLDNHERLSPDLEDFLTAGPPPLVFTLGSLLPWIADRFYEESARAAELLGCRAVLLVGENARSRLANHAPDRVFISPHAPHRALFRRALAIVHHGGVGTTGQALRSGRPMLVVPMAHDQPDNAARVVRLGVGRSLPFGAYYAERAAHELRRLLDGEQYLRRAAQVGAEIERENGVERACTALVDCLASCSEAARWSPVSG